MEDDDERRVTSDTAYVQWRRALENDAFIFNVGTLPHSCRHSDTVALSRSSSSSSSSTSLYGCRVCGRVHWCRIDPATCPMMRGPQTDYAHICIFSGRHVAAASTPIGHFEGELMARLGHMAVVGASSRALAVPGSKAARTHLHRANVLPSGAARRQAMAKADHAYAMQRSAQTIRTARRDMKRAYDVDMDQSSSSSSPAPRKRSRLGSGGNRRTVYEDGGGGGGGGGYGDGDGNGEEDMERDDTDAAATAVATGLSHAEWVRDRQWVARQWAPLRAVFAALVETLVATAPAPAPAPAPVSPSPPLPSSLSLSALTVARSSTPLSLSSSAATATAAAAAAAAAVVASAPRHFLALDEEPDMRQRVRRATTFLVDVLRQAYTCPPLPESTVALYARFTGNLAVIMGRALVQQNELYRFVAIVLLQLLTQAQYGRDPLDDCPIVLWTADPWLVQTANQHRRSPARFLGAHVPKAVREALRVCVKPLGHEVNKFVSALLASHTSVSALRSAIHSGLLLTDTRL